MILDEIAASTRERVEAGKRKISLSEMKKMSLMPENKSAFSFEKALQTEDISFICEVKKASPSKGIIAQEFPYLDIANEYEKIGASAISVLTEPMYFKGNNDYLREIVKNVSIPVLRKDFTIDEYQIYEAKALGADAVLLICSLLSVEQLTEYRSLCDELSLSALVETHDEDEVEKAIDAGARIIGVNNRNLKDFTVDVNTCIRLSKNIPSNIVAIAESGIKDSDDMMKIREANMQGVLIGETLMRSRDKKAMLAQLKGD